MNAFNRELVNQAEQEFYGDAAENRVSEYKQAVDGGELYKLCPTDSYTTAEKTEAKEACVAVVRVVDQELADRVANQGFDEAYQTLYEWAC